MEHTKLVAADSSAAAELPLDGVGARLRRAREAAGLSRADIAQRTRIADRHLAAIEEGRFEDLASRTYAVGFTRAYARAVGLDEAEVKRAVDDELGLIGSGSERSVKTTFEPGDPARVPSARTAWVAALGAALVIVAGFAFWRSYYSPAASLPSLLPASEPSAPPPAQTAPVPVTQEQGAVVFTARAPDVWVRFYDAAGNQLLQKVLAQGESFTVPADARDPMIRTARPDALVVTIGGKPVAPLSGKQEIVDMPVSAAALLARSAAPTPSPSSSASPSAMTSAAPAEAPKRPRPQRTTAASSPLPPPPPAPDAAQTSTVSQ